MGTTAPPTGLMKAMVLHGPGDMRWSDIPIPEVAPGDALVRVGACAICGSDVHMFGKGHAKLTYPRVIGHEFAGTVVWVDEQRSNYKAGDRVCTDVDTQCGSCYYCLNDRRNQCLNSRMIGANLDGAYAEYVRIPAGVKLYRLPGHVSFDEGAMVQTLGIAVRGVRIRGEVKVGDLVVVIGAGPIGLCLCLVAKASGARVISIDPIAGRRSMAAELGADWTLDPREVNPADFVAGISEGLGSDKVFEAVGGDQDETLMLATRLVKRGGIIVTMGTFPGNKASFHATEFKDREIEMRGSWGQFGTPQLCLDLIGSGLTPVGQMITHRMPLREAVAGLDLMASKEDSVVKIILHPGD